MGNLKEACGIFAVFGAKKASEITYLGLYALQHRGQEGSGMVSSDGNKVYSHKGLGLVNEVYPNQEVLGDLKGDRAIGHNRYSTTGSSFNLNNVQPILINYKDGPLA